MYVIVICIVFMFCFVCKKGAKIDVSDSQRIDQNKIMHFTSIQLGVPKHLVC